MKVLEGLISRWITRLYRIFATFPTRDPCGLPVLCSPTRAITIPRPKPRWLCLGLEKWERHSLFLNKRTQPFSIFLQSRLNESGRSTPHSLFYAQPPHLCGTPGLITWPHCLRCTILCTAKITVVWQGLWAPLRMRACLRCSATATNPAPRFYVNSFQNRLLASCG